MLPFKLLIMKENGSAGEAMRLYETLRVWLGGVPWRDARHLQTLAWMIVGLLCSSHVALTKWAPYVVGRAGVALNRPGFIGGSNL